MATTRLPGTPLAKIRRAVAGDLGAIARLGAMLAGAQHAMDPDRFFAPTPETPHGYASFLRSQLEHPDVIVLVAEERGEVVGYIYGTVEGKDWMAQRDPAGAVQDIIVAPESRGQGTGRALLDALIDAFAARGLPQVVLSTAARNDAAQRFFSRAGFRPTMVEMSRPVGRD